MLHMGDNKEPAQVVRKQNKSILPVLVKSTQLMFVS